MDALQQSEGPGFAWVTKCYTIENYVPADLLERAIRAVHPRLQVQLPGEQWEFPFIVPRSAPVDKVAIARRVCQDWGLERLDAYDLRRQVRRVVDLIRAANLSSSTMSS